MPDERSLWRHGDFIRLWGAQSISALGSQVTLLALPLTAIFALDASAAEVALLSTAMTFPSLALGLPAGVLVDRVRRRSVMIAADVGSAALLASVPLAYALGILSLPQLYVVAVVEGSLSVLFEIASQAYLPAIARASLVEANAKLEASRAVALAWGAWRGRWARLARDGAGRAAGGRGVVRRLGVSHRLGVAPRRAGASDGQLDAGPAAPPRGRTVRARPRPPASTPSRARAGEPRARPRLVDRDRLRRAGPRLGAGVVGAVLSLGQIGGFVGAAFARRAAVRFGVGRVLATAFFLFGPSTLLIAAAPRKAAIPFLALGWILENLGRALYGVCATSVRQALVPDRLQARVTGFQTTVGTGAFPLGTVAGSALVGLVGLRHALLAGALVAFLPFLPIVSSPLRSLRELPRWVDES